MTTKMEEMLKRCESATPTEPLYFLDESGQYNCMAVVFKYDVSYEQFSASAAVKSMPLIYQQLRERENKRTSTFTLRREETACWYSESGVLAVYLPEHVVVFTGYPENAAYELEQLGYHRMFVRVPGAGITVVPLCGAYLHSPSLA